MKKCNKLKKSNIFIVNMIWNPCEEHNGKAKVFFDKCCVSEANYYLKNITIKEFPDLVVFLDKKDNSSIYRMNKDNIISFIQEE